MYMVDQSLFLFPIGIQKTKSKVGVDIDVPHDVSERGSPNPTPTLLFMISWKCKTSIISLKNMWIAHLEQVMGGNKKHMFESHHPHLHFSNNITQIPYSKAT